MQKRLSDSEGADVQTEEKRVAGRHSSAPSNKLQPSPVHTATETPAPPLASSTTSDTDIQHCRPTSKFT